MSTFRAERIHFFHILKVNDAIDFGVDAAIILCLFKDTAADVDSLFNAAPYLTKAKIKKALKVLEQNNLIERA